MWITVYTADKTEILYELDDRTILIEKRLLFSPRNAGRKNFTIAHELAHQIINRRFPEVNIGEEGLFCDHRRSVKLHNQVSDWREWQADALAASILLPADAIKDAMFLFGLGEKMTVLSRKYSRRKYDHFCDMAEYAVASLQAGDDIKTIRANLGHATAAFTLQVYAHVNESMRQESSARMQRYYESVIL